MDPNQYFIPSYYYSNTYNLTLNSRHPCIKTNKQTNNLLGHFPIMQASLPTQFLWCISLRIKTKLSQLALFCPHHQSLATASLYVSKSILELGRIKASFIFLGSTLNKALVMIFSNVPASVTVTVAWPATTEDSPSRGCCAASNMLQEL